MIKTFKYGMLALILLTIWANIDNEILVLCMMLFGGSVTMVFILFVEFILWIEDCFDQAMDNLRKSK